jgi:hypothetical protein
MWYDLKQEVRRETMCLYHGSGDLGRCEGGSVGVVSGAYERVRTGDENGVFSEEYEMEDIAEGHFRFVEKHRRKMEKVPEMPVLRGKNHVNYVYGIGGEVR